MNRVRIETRNKYLQGKEEKLAEGVRQFLDLPLEKVEIRQIFWPESDQALSEERVKFLATHVFSDPILQIVQWKNQSKEKSQPGADQPSFAVEVSFRLGVTDNTGKAAEEALELVQISQVRVHTGTLYFLYGQLTHGEVERITKGFLANDLIHKIRLIPWGEFLQWDRFSPMNLVAEIPKQGEKVQVIPLQMGMEALLKMSEDKGWALSRDELEHIRKYFRQDQVIEERAKRGLPASPTDVEMEILAQTWSEHCKHKIFMSSIDYQEVNQKEYPDYPLPQLGTKKIHHLFKTYIKGATLKIMEERGITWPVSIFSDNAGMVRFDQHVDLCIKVETHNSPSALDPYGGALTGILGVNRDIMGCGMGARPVANTNIFCLSSPTTPQVSERQLWPASLKHPRQILQGVHLGIADGGNKSGIPTVNGSLVFDDDFSGKPLIFCGTLGVIPQQVGPKKDIKSFRKTPQVGDLVVVIGGAVGKDGIHGATLSSLEMNESTPATMVQIGDPLTQKRVMDFLMEARDLGLYTCLTDNGAGGLSSSVGEMALMTGGASIDLIHCPLKYGGLSPYEIMVSESQERMTLSVSPGDFPAFAELAENRGVTAVVLGKFDQSNFLQVFYRGEAVAFLSLDFLHHSLPPMQLKATWKGPQERSWLGVWRKEGDQRSKLQKEDWQRPELIKEALLKLLQLPNICSKESLVRQYDHEVLAATHIRPFVGGRGEGPSDAGVLSLAPYGGEEKRGVAIGHGIAPKLSHFDTYLMAQWAVDEAMRNVVATGGNPQKTCLVDNFCWPDPVASAKNPDGEHKLAQLVRACQGLYESTQVFAAPLVSGKDSMKNDYTGRDGQGRPLKISVPPTLLMTAVSDVEDLSFTATSDFKEAGDLLYLLGRWESGWGGSEFQQLFHWEGVEKAFPPKIDLKANAQLYIHLHQGLRQGFFRSVHDLSDGGALVAVVESMIGGNLGADLNLHFAHTGEKFLEWLFNESPGRFVVSVPPEMRIPFEQFFSSMPITSLGKVSQEKGLRVSTQDVTLLQVSLEELKRSWRSMW